MNPNFHLAFPVTDIQSTREFYEGLPGCKKGYSVFSAPRGNAIEFKPFQNKERVFVYSS